MLRICSLQQWFNLSDPAVEKSLSESLAMRDFARIDLGREPTPDETTACNFSHLLEEHDLGLRLCQEVRRHLETQGELIHSVVATAANVADSTILPDRLHGDETRVWGD